MEDSMEKEDTAVVLYQKMGNQWFAFSLVDDDVFFGQVPEEALLEEIHESQI